MARQFLAFPASSAGAERLFSRAGKMHDDHKKSTDEVTLENQLLISMNYPDAWFVSSFDPVMFFVTQVL